MEGSKNERGNMLFDFVGGGQKASMSLEVCYTRNRSGGFAAAGRVDAALALTLLPAKLRSREGQEMVRWDGE
eukprot:4620411-Prymnesium_polylepis.1